MNKFRVNKPLSNSDNGQDIRIQNFANGANEHKIEHLNLNPKAKPSKSFTVPLNEYELSLLQKLSQNLNRSQRYIARTLLAKVLEEELDIDRN